MEKYKTVLNQSSATYVVERSKFIAHVAHIESSEQAREYIDKVKKEYWDARHNVYAYVLKNGEARCSDDGEPSSTAGMPVLNVIKGAGLSDTVVVVTRYFGGILLGTGGLVRAYSKAAGDGIAQAETGYGENCTEIKITVPYSGADRIKRFLEDSSLTPEHTDYAAQVSFLVFVPEDMTESFVKKITDFTSGSVKPELGKTVFRIRSGKNSK